MRWTCCDSGHLELLLPFAIGVNFARLVEEGLLVHELDHVVVNSGELWQEHHASLLLARALFVAPFVA